MPDKTRMLAPLADEELRTFKGRGGKTMTFIEDETVMDRLDVGYGVGNWQILVDPVDLSSGVVKVRLGVRDLGDWTWYEDFGYPNQPDGDVLKEAVSDGIRRCGRYVGIARDLYRKSTYEPGGALGPKAAAEPEPVVETEELLGIQSREGTVKIGGAANYKLEERQTPAGPAFGFALDTGKGNLPQVLVEGDLAAAVIIAEKGDPANLKGHWCRVKGRLYSVRAPGRSGYFRMRVTEFETREYKVPDPDAPSMPLGLVPEAEAELDAVLP